MSRHILHLKSNISEDAKRDYVLGLYRAWDEAVGREAALRLTVQTLWPDHLNYLPYSAIRALAAKVIE